MAISFLGGGEALPHPRSAGGAPEGVESSLGERLWRSKKLTLKTQRKKTVTILRLKRVPVGVGSDRTGYGKAMETLLNPDILVASL